MGAFQQGSRSVMHEVDHAPGAEDPSRDVLIQQIPEPIAKSLCQDDFIFFDGSHKPRSSLAVPQFRRLGHLEKERRAY